MRVFLPARRPNNRLTIAPDAFAGINQETFRREFLLNVRDGLRPWDLAPFGNCRGMRRGFFGALVYEITGADED